MDKKTAYSIINNILKQQYGEFLTLERVGIIRRATGARWAGKVNILIDNKNIPVGMIELNVNGDLSSIFTKSDIINVIKSYIPNKKEEDPFADIFEDEDNVNNEEIYEKNNYDIKTLRKQIDSLLQNETIDSLSRARDLYPILLELNTNKGDILHEMGLLELALDNPNLALEYMENAVLEYANFADLNKMQKVETSVFNLLGNEQLNKTKISSTISNTKKHLKPIKSLTNVPLFFGLPKGTILELEIISEDIILKPGEIIIKEGEPAVFALIIKANTLEVVLESFAMKPKVIRSCFPGEFLGESSIIAKPGTLTCTATLKAGPKGAKLWKFNAEDLIDVMTKFPTIANRISNAKNIHLLDSFFSMHPTMNALNSETRDKFLSCLKKINSYPAKTRIITKKSIPKSAFLVINGKIEVISDNESIQNIDTDHFIAMSDVLHGIETEREYFATSGTVLAEFDGDKLRNMALESSAGIVAIMERLN